MAVACCYILVEISVVYAMYDVEVLGSPWRGTSFVQELAKDNTQTSPTKWELEIAIELFCIQLYYVSIIQKCT